MESVERRRGGQERRGEGGESMVESEQRRGGPERKREEVMEERKREEWMEAERGGGRLERKGEECMVASEQRACTQAPLCSASDLRRRSHLLIFTLPQNKQEGCVSGGGAGTREGGVDGSVCVPAQACTHCMVRTLLLQGSSPLRHAAILAAEKDVVIIIGVQPLPAAFADPITV
eukprot:1784112-Rhodomonas_salina.1